MQGLPKQIWSSAPISAWIWSSCILGGPEWRVPSLRRRLYLRSAASQFVISGKNTQEASRQSRLDSATPTVGCRYVPPFFAQNDGCLWQTAAVTESTWYYSLYDQLVICFCFCSSLAILLVSLQVLCFVSRELCSEARRAPDHALCIHAGILREEDLFKLESRLALHRNSDLSDSCLCRQFVNVMRGKDESMRVLSGSLHCQQSEPGFSSAPDEHDSTHMAVW